ncbi:MAG: ABC transporter substrate-binding protein [Beijerinckiaceae bacterium]
MSRKPTGALAVHFNPRLSLLAAGILASLAMPGQFAVAQTQTLSLYCSNLEEQCRALASAFERHSGITVRMVRKSTNEFLTQIRAEASNPQGDVWWGGPADAHWAASDDHLLDAYRSPAVDALYPWAKSHAEKTGFRTTGVYAGAVGIGYNSKILAAKSIAPPRCWADLADGRFAGEVQMADPRASGTSYLFVTMTLERLGETGGFGYLTALAKNVNQFTKSGTAPVKALALGETGVAIAFLHGMAPEIKSGAPIVTVIPCEGTGYEIIGMSLLKGAKNQQAAKAFVDFALSREAQSLNAALNIPATPVRADATRAENTPDFSAVTLIDADVAKYANRTMRAHILQRFDALVRGAGQ